MDLIERDLLRHGRKIGVLYEPASARMAPAFRVVRESDGHVAFRAAPGDCEPFKGAWAFDADAFGRFIRILRVWWRGSDAMGGYRTVRSGYRHTCDLYRPPGREAVPFGIGEADTNLLAIRREGRAGRTRAGMEEVARYRNGRGDVVVWSFRWDALRVYWTCSELVLVRGFDPGADEEARLVDFICFGVETSGGGRRRFLSGRNGQVGHALWGISRDADRLSVGYEEGLYLREAACAIVRGLPRQGGRRERARRERTDATAKIGGG